MIIRLGNFNATTKAAVTASAAAFTAVGKYQWYVVYATVKVQLNLVGTADTTSFVLEQGSYVEIRILDTDTLSYICYPGEPDGQIFITIKGE